MLLAGFESDKRETRAELLGYTCHGFPSAPNAQKTVPRGTTAEINQPSARVYLLESAIIRRRCIFNAVREID